MADPKDRLARPLLSGDYMQIPGGASAPGGALLTSAAGVGGAGTGVPSNRTILASSEVCMFLACLPLCFWFCDSAPDGPVPHQN